MYLDAPEAEEENQEPGGPAGVEEEEEEQDKRGRDDEHERRLGLQLHDLGVRVLLPTQGNIALLGRLRQQRQPLPHAHIDIISVLSQASAETLPRSTFGFFCACVRTYLFSDDGDGPHGGAGHRADGHHPEERYGAVEGRLQRRVHENVDCTQGNRIMYVRGT
jgi:hypothetical protein